MGATKARFWLTAIVSCALAASAHAEPPSNALRAYAIGDYMSAAAVAEAQPSSSSSMAFAARALMAACLTTSDRSQIDPLLDRAESAAQNALTLDPASVEGRLQLALTLGVRARRANIAEAMAHNYAPRGHRLLQEALSREPDNAWAHELLGAWNLEVLRRGGTTGAALYGARLSTGMAEFERAHALAPDDPMITLHFAVALLELDHAKYADRARSLLEAATASTPRDAFETQTLARAREVAAILSSDGSAAANLAARRAFL